MLTKEKINKVHEMSAAIHTAKDVASEQLRTAQDRYEDRKHKLTREGKEIELTEKVLWEEVFYIGPASEAGKILRKEYPEVFKAYENQDRAAADLKAYTIKELGVDYTQMTLSDYLKLTEEMYDYLMGAGRFKARSPWQRFKNLFRR